ncbi:conserved hypothetical protein [Shewanella halifaxensis HAW-EB4]|uniref:Transmembrane cytochrome oxidase associated protein n=1 Tax=Shewanella halifaxensis (strain HAW-EB4) TaxID=458817 RepID=B0TNS6_SHEHH|nr:hypothetical protein [Shewanella halifaxensis]ABZ74829.1 conserved hypothetical protein [Shewanella halifaxensis HAW-EB4]
MNSPQKNGKKTLLLLLLAFALPVIAAKLVLSFNLYQGGVTNKGQLLDTDISYQSLAMVNPQPHEWQLLYQLPNHCDAVCKDRLYILQQSHVALGRNQDRVHTIIMINEHSDTAALDSSDFVTAIPSKALSQLLAQQELVIVDPLGSLVMSYPIAADHQSQIMQGKALVADLRKLLKLSRIG